MPREEDIVDQSEELHFDPEFDNFLYSAGIEYCLFEESAYCSMFSQIGDQEMWRDHFSSKYIISFCGGITRVWKEEKKEVEELNLNPRNLHQKEVSAEISR